jgi:GntR family transcriptional regulator
MDQISSNAGRARSVLRDAIATGIYPIGSSLPSTRNLADRFGINRNTATKIYHELATDGLVELLPNRPPVVRGDKTHRTGEELRTHVRNSVRELLLECRLAGVSDDDARKLFVTSIEEYFSSRRNHSIMAAECNEEEALALAQDLSLKLGVTIEPVLINELSHSPDADLVVTPYFHLLEARKALEREHTPRVVGVIVTADGSDLARVASAVSSGPLGVVAFHQHAVERLRSLLSFQIEIPMLTATVEHPETIETLRDRVECIACTLRAYPIARQLVPDIPLHLVHYHVDHESIARLRRELRDLASQK